MLLTSDEFAGLVDEAGLPDGCRHVVLGEELEPGVARTRCSRCRVDRAEDPALMIFTSGTTANPKGCVLSHGALLAAGRNSPSAVG